MVDDSLTYDCDGCYETVNDDEAQQCNECFMCDDCCECHATEWVVSQLDVSGQLVRTERCATQVEAFRAGRAWEMLSRGNRFDVAEVEKSGDESEAA